MILFYQLFNLLLFFFIVWLMASNAMKDKSGFDKIVAGSFTINERDYALLCYGAAFVITFFMYLVPAVVSMLMCVVIGWI